MDRPPCLGGDAPSHTPSSMEVNLNYSNCSNYIETNGILLCSFRYGFGVILMEFY